MSVELVAVAKEKFTSAESKLLNEITRSESIIEVTIADDITPDAWHSTVSVVGRAYLRATIQEAKTLPVMGRLLVIAEKRPEIWEGFDSFKQFITTEISEKFGISVSSAYEAIGLAKRMPHLEISQIEAIPRRNMRLVLQAVPKGDEKKGTAKTLLEKASTMTEHDLREFCEKKGYIGIGEAQGAFVRVPCSKKVLKMWDQFIEDPQIQAVCGSDKPGDILEHMLESCADWKAIAEDLIKSIDSVPEEAPAA